MMRHAVAVALGLMVILPLPAAAGQALEGWSAVETEHVLFHFPPRPRVNPETFAAAEEQAFSRLRATFTGSLPGKIDFYVWNTSEEVRMKYPGAVAHNGARLEETLRPMKLFE